MMITRIVTALIAAVLAIAGPDGEWRVFNSTGRKPPSNPDHWEFPAAGSTKIVPVTEEEAGLSMQVLFDALIRADPSEKQLMDPNPGFGCVAPPVRICGK